MGIAWLSVVRGHRHRHRFWLPQDLGPSQTRPLAAIQIWRSPWAQMAVQDHSRQPGPRGCHVSSSASVRHAPTAPLLSLSQHHILAPRSGGWATRWPACLLPAPAARQPSHRSLKDVLSTEQVPEQSTVCLMSAETPAACTKRNKRRRRFPSIWEGVHWRQAWGVGWGAVGFLLAAGHSLVNSLCPVAAVTLTVPSATPRLRQALA